MSYKKTDQVFKNWRYSSIMLPPISNHFKKPQQLNENWRDKLFQLMTGASLILGTAVSIDYLRDLERRNKEKIEQRDNVDLDSMSEYERYHYVLKKEIEAEIDKNPELAKKFTDPESDMYSVYGDGLYKGKIDRVSVMKKYTKKYKDDLNVTDNGNYVYIEPGAIDPDEVLPLSGITADQYKKLLSSDKNFMELIRVAMGNPQSWTYGKDITQQFAMIEYEGQYKNVLPLDWSIAMDAATAKGQAFMDEVAQSAYVDSGDGNMRVKQLDPRAFEQIKKKYGIYNQSDYQRAMWNLNDFLSTDTHTVWDQIEDFAGVDRTHPRYEPGGLRGFDVSPEDLPARSSLDPDQSPPLQGVNKFKQQIELKESIKDRRKVCIKILKS